jgi:branched-chain amino acid aminotransferase
MKPSPQSPRAKYIWLNGDLLPWDEARVHLMTHTLHYGLGVFEGIRYYKRAGGRTAVFRLDDHIRRLFDSAHICLMPLPYTPQEIADACVLMVQKNGLAEGYIRPIAYIAEGAMGLGAIDNPIHVAIAVYPWGAYLGEDGLKNGIRAKISSFARHHVNSGMAKGKICGQYVNSILAKREAKLAGYDEAIMLDTDGYVAEASGENVFMVRDGVLRTPPLSSSVLGGITRATIIALSHEVGLPIIRQKFSRDELYTADEVFLTGTAAEVTPVREVDNRRIGSGRPGIWTQRFQELFFDIVRGSDSKHDEWLRYTDARPAEAAKAGVA